MSKKTTITQLVDKWIRKPQPESAEKLDAKPSYRCTSDEVEAARKEARRRGMTFSQLVRLAVNDEVKRGICNHSERWRR